MLKWHCRARISAFGHYWWKRSIYNTTTGKLSLQLMWPWQQQFNIVVFSFFPFFFCCWSGEEINVRVFKVHDWHLFHLLLPPDKRLYRLPRCFIISKSPLPSIDAASNKSYIVNCSVKLFFGALFLTFLVQFWHFSAVSTELPAWLMGTPAYKMMNFTYLEVGMDVY